MAKNPVANIGVDLTAKIAGFEANMTKATRSLSANQKKMNRSLSRIEGGFKKLGASIGAFAGVAGVGLAVRGLNNIFERAIDAGDEIGKAAKTAGIGAEALQEYRFAAMQAGSSQKELDDAVGRFTRRLGEARRGNQEYAKTFKELGVQASDTTEQAIEKAFKALGDVKDITIRTSLATKVFGDDARRMALLVADGADALEATKKQARDMGAVINEKTIPALEKAKDKISIMNAALETQLTNAVADNIEAFTTFKGAINNVEIALVKASAAAINFFDAKDFTQTTVIEERLQSERKNLSELQDLLKRTQSSGGLATIGKDSRTKRLQKDIAEAKDLINRLERAQSDVQFKNINDSLNRPQQSEPIVPPPPDFSGIKIPNAPTLKLDAFAKRAETAGEKIRAAFEQTRTPLEALSIQLKEIEALRPFAQTPEELDALGRAADDVRDQMKELNQATSEWKLVSQDAARGISDAFADAIIFGDKLGQSLKRLAQQLSSRLISNLLFSAATDAFPFLNSKAGGGRIQPNIPTLVGERGPELIVPQRAATVINNADSRGLGRAPTINISITNTPNFAGNAATFEDLRLMGQITKQAAIDGTMQALRRPKFA